MNESRGVVDPPPSAGWPASDEVAGRIRDRIVSGGLAPGDVLRTSAIARELGVDVGRAREGLLMLQREGFVDLIPRQGFRVIDVADQGVRDLFWTQATIAGELAARAAGRITDAELAVLGDLLAEHRVISAAGGDLAGIVAVGWEFHRRIHDASGSPRLFGLLETVLSQMPVDVPPSLGDHLERVFEDHGAILAALRGRDGGAARRLMRDHLLAELAKVLELQRSAGTR